MLKSVPVFSSVYKIKVRNVLNTFRNLFLKFHLTLYVFKYKVYVMNCLIISKTGHTCQKKAIDQYHWKWHLAFWPIYYLGIHKTSLEKHICELISPIKKLFIMKDWRRLRFSTEEDKVHIFWEGHKISRNLPLTFDYSTYSQKLGEDFAKFCGLLRIYELYLPNQQKPFIKLAD